MDFFHNDFCICISADRSPKMIWHNEKGPQKGAFSHCIGTIWGVLERFLPASQHVLEYFAHSFGDLQHILSHFLHTCREGRAQKKDVLRRPFQKPTTFSARSDRKQYDAQINIRDWIQRHLSHDKAPGSHGVRDGALQARCICLKQTATGIFWASHGRFCDNDAD